MDTGSRRESEGAPSLFLRVARTVLLAIVCIAMFTMMMLTTADVTGRALLNFPIKGSDEIVAFLFAIVIFAALPLVTWDQQHITVSLFERWLRGPVEKVLAVLISATCTVVVAGIAYRLWIQANLMAEGRHVTGALEWPIAPIVYVMSGFSTIAAIILLILTWEKLRGGSRISTADRESKSMEID